MTGQGFTHDRDQLLFHPPIEGGDGEDKLTHGLTPSSMEKAGMHE